MSKLFLLLFVAYIPCAVIAQEVSTTGKAAQEKEWAFTMWGDYYIIPGDIDFLMPVFSADHNAWHFEARYNYEDLNTASVFAGWRLETGKQVEIAFTPIIGSVFGNPNGIAPGYELEIVYKAFDLYSESEYMFDFSGKENNFFYTWTELAVMPTDQLRTGITIQRTRLYQTEFEIQRGLLAEYYFGKFRAGVYYFSPFSSDNFLVASFSVDF